MFAYSLAHLLNSQQQIIGEVHVYSTQTIKPSGEGIYSIGVAISDNDDDRSSIFFFLNHMRENTCGTCGV